MKSAFTLVELLVVITIIIVLLALLAPAMDRAIYQAELAACGAKLDAGAGSMIIYAMDHRRAYAVRGQLSEGLGSMIPTLIRQAEHDLRLAISDYLKPNKHLLCPLTRPVNLETQKPDTTLILSTYDLWFGWAYRNGPQVYRGLYRLGGRFEWQPATGERLTFDVLMGDQTDRLPAWTGATHPDQLGILAPEFREDESNPWTAGGMLPGEVIGDVTYSMWSGTSRGLVDMNFAFQDGSVLRYPDTKPQQDSLLEEVPTYSNDRAPGRVRQIPPAR
jgi:competence protein ComGC